MVSLQPRDEPNEEERQEELDGDYAPPFSPPEGILDTTDDTHPDADDYIDPQEQYDEGIAAASGVDDPGNRGILGYSPPDDED